MTIVVAAAILIIITILKSQLKVKCCLVFQLTILALVLTKATIANSMSATKKVAHTMGIQ